MPTTTPAGIPIPIPDDSVDVPRDFNASMMFIDPFLSKLVPAGSMLMWPGAVAPNPYWVICAGQTDIPAAANPGLVAIFGQTGGFVNAIPDMRDKFPVGVGPGGGTGDTPAHPLTGPGSTGGANRVKLTSAESGMVAHDHGAKTGSQTDANAHGHNVQGYIFVGDINTNYAIPPGSSAGAGWRYGNVQSNATDTQIQGDHKHTIAQQAGAAAANSHENQPSFRAINFIMKLG